MNIWLRFEICSKQKRMWSDMKNIHIPPSSFSIPTALMCPSPPFLFLPPSCVPHLPFSSYLPSSILTLPLVFVLALTLPPHLTLLLPLPLPLALALALALALTLTLALPLVLPLPLTLALLLPLSPTWTLKIYLHTVDMLMCHTSFPMDSLVVPLW